MRENFRPKRRGRREGRMRAAPAVSRAMCTKEHAHEHTGSAENIRPSLRNGFTAYSVLSPATNSCCHRRLRIDGFARSGWIDNTSASLTSATDARTTRLRRTQPVFANRIGGKCTPTEVSTKADVAPFVCAPVDRSQADNGLALRLLCAPALPRPPRPVPTFVTMANAPLAGRDGASFYR
jgi:hypothetical protein